MLTKNLNLSGLKEVFFIYKLKDEKVTVKQKVISSVEVQNAYFVECPKKISERYHIVRIREQIKIKIRTIWHRSDIFCTTNPVGETGHFCPKYM